MITIFGEINGVFLKCQCYDQFFSKVSFVLSKNASFFPKYFGENIFKIISSVPGLKTNPDCRQMGVLNGATLALEKMTDGTIVNVASILGLFCAEQPKVSREGHGIHSVKHCLFFKNFCHVFLEN
jgi:hypothetical protein